MFRPHTVLDLLWPGQRVPKPGVQGMRTEAPEAGKHHGDKSGIPYL